MESVSGIPLTTPAIYFNQIVHLCYIIDQDNFPSLTKNYEVYPCDQITRYYASYTFYHWTDPNTNPTFSQLNSINNITVTLRSNKDPFVVGYTKVDILKTHEDNSMLFWGLIIGILSLCALYIPLRLILTEDEFPLFHNRENRMFRSSEFDMKG